MHRQINTSEARADGDPLSPRVPYLRHNSSTLEFADQLLALGHPRRGGIPAVDKRLTPQRAAYAILTLAFWDGG